MIQQSRHRSALDRVQGQVGSPGLAAFLALFIFAVMSTAELLPRVSGRTLDPKGQSTQQPRDAGNGADDEKDVRALEPGRPVKRELAGGQQHGYQVELNSGQFLKVTVEQQGIDVAVQVLGSDGKQIFEFDSESRLQGQEEVSLVAEAAGGCRLMIRPKEKGAAAGSYEIRIEELRAATENDRALHEARRLYEDAVRLHDAGKYDEAFRLLERALEIRERILEPDRPDVAATLHTLAVLYWQKGEYAKAEPLYGRALAIYEKALGPEHPKIAATLNNLAIIYLNRGDDAKAEPLLQRALAICEKALGPDHPDVARSLNSLANLYFNRGDNAKAEPLYRRALAIYERALGPDYPDVASPLNNLAFLYLDRGEYAKAEPLLHRALAIQEKALGPDHPKVAKSLDTLALLYRQKGEYAKAEPLYERALAINEKALGPGHPNVARSLNSLGDLYRVRGEYAKAEPLLQRALSINEKAVGPDHPGVAASLNNLANLYFNKGEYAKAEPLYGRALAIREKVLGPDAPDVATSLNNFANLYLDRGEYAKAEPLLQRALAIYEKTVGPDHPDVSVYLNTLANLYLDRGEYAKAEPLLQRALAIDEKTLGPQHRHVAAVLGNFARLRAAEGDLAQAVVLQSRANAISERHLALNLADGSERQKLAYLALFSTETDFTLSLHSRFPPNDPKALDLAFTTLLRRKGRGLDAMVDTVAALRRRAKPEDRALLDQLAEARSRLAAFTLREASSAKPETYRAQLEPLEEEVEKLEAMLSSRSEEFLSQARPITLSAVQAALPAGSVLVEFAVFTPYELQTEKNKPPRYLAYLLPAQGRPRSVDLGEAAAIDRAIDAWRKTLRDPNRLDVKRLARAVDQRVMRPVRALLQSGLAEVPGGTRHLLIAPDGLLNLIPFAALVDEKNRYLVERYSISYLTSGRDLLRMETSEPSDNPPLVVANPVFGKAQTVAMRSDRKSAGSRPGKQNGRDRQDGQGGQDGRDEPVELDPTEVVFYALPGTRREALAIKAVMPKASVLLREQATETAIKQTRAPSILHIATHGFFLNDQEAPSHPPDGSPPPAEVQDLAASGPLSSNDVRLSRWAAKVENPLLRSGLALAGANERRGEGDDGVLTAMEAASLDLWGTRLVVLSACDTGVGEIKNGEGVYGLRRALVLAGSETQIMSLWPVLDRETSSLIAGYYKRLLKGEGRGEALRAIQLELLKDARLRHPYHWASFIQAGEWANLDGRR